MKAVKRLFFLLFVAPFLSCGDGPAPERAVYHWESVYDLGPEETGWLDRNGIGRIYLRLFDIDRDESLQAPVPVGNLQVADTSTDIGLEVVPCFFITNRTFENISETQTDSLAARILRKAGIKLHEQLGNPLVREWQFDCDWTEGTREAYFRFLRLMGQALKKEGIQLSATIRLHQVKYFGKTGVPPVDRGMLMFYNMGDVEDPETRNSILDMAAARQYYSNFGDYPLPLDLALPAFRWGVVFREGKMVRLINGLAPEDLGDGSRFAFRDATHVEVVKSTYLDGYYLYGGDEIRLEWASGGQLREAAGDLVKIMAKGRRWVCFFQLAPEMIKQYSDEEWEGIWDSMER